MKKIIGFFKAQPVLVIAFAAALITVFIIPPDAQYSGYINSTVLIQLFCLMASVGGFRSIGVFENVAGFVMKKAGNIRRLGFIFMLVCFFSSMFVTNDVALLTFVPLTLMVYNKISDEKSRIVTVVLETAAANLGSMITPFGNPQNLYIYDMYKLSVGDFFRTMLPTGIASLVMLTMLCFLLPTTECRAETSGKKEVHKIYFGIYTALFVLCLLTVFRIVPPAICLLATFVFVPMKQLEKVDYCLLATFVCFFVFVGNIARIETVSGFFSEILNGREVIVSALLSQVISNVPASVMLSGFTDNGKALLLGVNLGGLGTVIASLASLISFQFYRNSEDAKSGKYMLVFSAVNFGMLAVLLALALLR
ncbi:MAG: SLC13 family permease [Ruminococcus flavefaciens]|nr:SLC13 family permease [Ruminococcus flavefaciens]MCM1228649.1 SLC13 family permease [Ruminococcus flavefaciens]